MSNELGATKINELINTADTSDNEDDEVVSNILNELEGTGDDNFIEKNLINGQLMHNLSNNQDDVEDMEDSEDGLFNTDNNIFNTSDVQESPSTNSINLPSHDNDTIIENKSSNTDDTDLTSFLPPDHMKY